MDLEGVKKGSWGEYNNQNTLIEILKEQMKNNIVVKERERIG